MFNNAMLICFELYPRWVPLKPRQLLEKLKKRQKKKQSVVVIRKAHAHARCANYYNI